MMAHESRMSEQATNVKFVYEIKKRPCLYNPDLMSFARKDITEQAWDEVGKIMNMTGGACKEKWRNLRIVYMRHMKSSRYSGTGRRKRRYYLSDAMQFLLPFMKILPPGASKSELDEQEKEKTFYDAYRFSKENEQPEEAIPESWQVPVVKIKTDDDHSNDTSINQELEEVSSRKRSVQDPEHYNFLKDSERVDHSTPCYVMDSNDPIRSFLASLVPELHEMNTTQFKRFKRRVLALIDDITDDNGIDMIKKS